MLSATPHQGKTDAFQRLVSLIDSQVFPDVDSITSDRVQPYVIRTEKRHAIDADGKPLFKPRRTELAPVKWEERHKGQEHLYNAVTEYVRQGYNQAMKEKRSYIGFLMIHQLDLRAQIIPEMVPFLLIRLYGGGDDA